MDLVLREIESLKKKENPVEALERMKVHLIESPNLEFVHILILGSDEIYDYLEDSADGSSRQQVDLASDILCICMSNMSLVSSNFYVLKRAICHKNVKIRSLALNMILAAMEKQFDKASTFYDGFSENVSDAIQEQEAVVATPAAAIVSILLKSKQDARYIKSSLFRALHKNTLVRCRIFQLAVNVATASPEKNEDVEWIIYYALAQLDTDNVLLQTKIMEILAPLLLDSYVSEPKRQVVDAIKTCLESIKDDETDWLLLPGIMKFLGNSAALEPKKIISRYPHMIECLFKCITSGDPSTFPDACDTMGNLFRNRKAVLLLEAQHSDKLQDVFQQLSSYLSKLPNSDLKIRIFQTLEIVFAIDDDPKTMSLPARSHDVKSTLQKWFSHLAGGANMCFLFELCRNPIPDVQLACMSFIKAICRYDWGIVALKDTAGLVEHLLDTESEYNQQTKDASYEVIKLLAESTSVFDMLTECKLRQYVNAEPCIMQSAMEVAVEGN